jgi:hypothetical protein
MQRKKWIKPRSMSYLMIVAVTSILASLLVAPALSVSSNPCSPCHNTYNQQLDILEGNSQNSIPTTIQVGQTLTVTVAVQNINNVARYSQLSSVVLTLNSQNSHFTVTNPTYNIATLTGTVTATWQITGTSAGSDALVITATARNSHQNIQFQDSYVPNPTLTVTSASGSTPLPTQAATPTATPTPIVTPAPTINPTSNPQSTLTPTPTPTPTDVPSSTVSPDPSTTQVPQPTAAAPTPTSTVPSSTPTPTPQNGHELNSIMLYIHPPLAIVGYALVFLFAVLIFIKKTRGNLTTYVGVSLWSFTFLGLLTGMLWAQWAWGSFWSWDPKETLTLALFLSVSASQVAYFEKKVSASKWAILLSCILTVVTGLSGFITAGLHSFL